MIRYAHETFAPDLRQEMRSNTKDLPPYKGGPGVDYSKALHAYALNATLLYDPLHSIEDIQARGPSEAAEILLVQRASGDGVIGSWSGVTGYIDTMHNPADPDDGQFDPIHHTLYDELVTECAITPEVLDAISFSASQTEIFPRTKLPEAIISIVPILGVCSERPHITVNPKELSAHRWVPLQEVAAHPDLSPGYLESTLPRTLSITGLNLASATWLQDPGF